ncbi:MAG: DUF6883 domain-containing protein [Isosphaeraceae bacterium]
MKIPEDAVIPVEKLTKYLLVPRPWDDKSRFLAQAGLDQSNPDALMAAIRALAIRAEGSEDESNEYGTFYRLEGSLVGPGGQSLAVVTVWMRWHADRSFHFVTLKPWRNPRP